MTENRKTIRRLQNKIDVLVATLYRLASNEPFALLQEIDRTQLQYEISDLEQQLRMLFAEYCAKICDNKNDVGDVKQYQAILPEWRKIVVKEEEIKPRKTQKTLKKKE